MFRLKRNDAQRQGETERERENEGGGEMSIATDLIMTGLQSFRQLDLEENR